MADAGLYLVLVYVIHFQNELKSDVAPWCSVLYQMSFA